jgi:hypothetical protein
MYFVALLRQQNCHSVSLTIKDLIVGEVVTLVQVYA